MLHNEKIKATVQSSVGSKYGDYIPRYYETHNTEGWVKDALEDDPHTSIPRCSGP